MRRGACATVVSAVVLATGMAAPAAAAPPREVTVGIQLLAPPVFGERRETGPVVHFEFRASAFISGEQPGITSEHFSCVRRVGEVIRCTARVETDYIGGSGHSTSRTRLTCDPGLIVCEGITHVTGVDNDGGTVRGSGRLRVVNGVGSAVLRLTHG